MLEYAVKKVASAMNYLIANILKQFRKFNTEFIQLLVQNVVVYNIKNPITIITLTTPLSQ